jgi:hypothetical protein
LFSCGLFVLNFEFFFIAFMICSNAIMGNFFFLLFCSFLVWSYDHDVHIVMKNKNSSLYI